MSRKLLGYCAVDSGQILLTDPCYVHDFIDGEEYNPTPEGEDYPYSYNGACGATLHKGQGGQLHFKLGHAGAGVCVASGWGDGMYPVVAEYNSEGRVQSVTITFITDEGEAEEYDEDYDEDDE
jgi:hypothetical protein